MSNGYIWKVRTNECTPCDLFIITKEMDIAQVIATFKKVYIKDNDEEKQPRIEKIELERRCLVNW